MSNSRILLTKKRQNWTHFIIKYITFRVYAIINILYWTQVSISWFHKNDNIDTPDSIVNFRTKCYSHAYSQFQWTETAALDSINEASIQRSWLVTVNWPIKMSPRNSIGGIRERPKLFKGCCWNHKYNRNESLKFKLSFLKKKSHCEFREFFELYVDEYIFGLLHMSSSTRK